MGGKGEQRSVNRRTGPVKRGDGTPLGNRARTGWREGVGWRLRTGLDLPGGEFRSLP